MDICQDEECPNYVTDEPNKCITFKQVSECPTPDYLKDTKTHSSVDLQRRVICSHAGNRGCKPDCVHIEEHLAEGITEVDEAMTCKDLGMCSSLNKEVYCKSI